MCETCKVTINTKISVTCDRRTAARVKGKVHEMVMTYCQGWFGGSGTDRKKGGSKAEDVQIFVGREQDGQDWK